MSSGNLDALSAIATVLNPNMEEYHEGGVEHETIIVTSADGQILEEAYIITSEPQEVKDTGQGLQDETEAETFCDLDESTKEAGQQLQQRLIKEELKAAWEQELAANGFVVCSVPGCSMKYSTIVSFEGHYKWCTGENGEGVETCEYCNCQFLTCIQGIEDHVKKEHPTEINDYCAKRVARKIIKECREKEQKAKELKEAKALNLKRERQVSRNSYQRRQTCYSKKSPVLNKSDSDNSKDGADKKVRFHKAVSVIHTEKQEGEEDIDDPGTMSVKEKPKKGQPPKKETEVLQLARNWGVQRKTYSRSGPSTDCSPSKDIFGPEFDSVLPESGLPTQETATTTTVTRSVTAKISEKIDEANAIDTNSLQVDAPVEVSATTSEVDQQSDQVVTFLNEDDDGNVMIPIETEGCITVGDETQENEENYQLVIVTGESGESQYIVIDDSISQALADGSVSLDDNNELVSENSCFNVVTSNVETYNSTVDEIEVAAEEFNNENDLETVEMEVQESNTIVVPEPSDPVITLPVKTTKKVVFVEPKPEENVPVLSNDDLISTMPTADKWVEGNRKSIENKKILIRKRKVKPTQLESGSDDSDLTVDRFQLQTPTNLPSINIGDDFLPPNLNKLLEFGSGRSDKNKSDLSSSEGSSSPSSNRKEINGSWVEPKNALPIYQKSLIRNSPIISKSTVPSLQPSIAVKSVIHPQKSKAIEVPVPITTKSIVTEPKNIVTDPKIVQESSVVKKDHPLDEKTIAKVSDVHQKTSSSEKDLPLIANSMREDAELEKVEKTNTSEVKKTVVVKESTSKIDSPQETVSRKNQEDGEIPEQIITESSSQHQEESRASNTSESSSLASQLKSDSGFSSFHDLTGLTGNPHIKIYTPNSDGTLAPLEDFSILSSNPQIRIMTPETDGTLKPMIIGDKDLILKTVQKMIATGSSSGTIKTHDNKISVLPEASEKNNRQPQEIDIGTTPISLEETNSSLLNEDNNSRNAIEPLSASEEPTTISMPEVPPQKNEELINIENELLKGYSTPTRMDYEEVVPVDSNAVATTKIIDTPIKRKRGRPPRVDSAQTSSIVTDVTRINNSNSTPPRKIFKPNIKSQESKLTLSNSDLSSQIDTTMDESLSNDFGNLKNSLSVASETGFINTSFTSVLDSVSDSDSNLPPARRGGPAMRGGRWARRRAGKRGRPYGRGRSSAEAVFEPQALDDDEDEVDTYQCSACQLIFADKVVATNHIISKHNGLARLNNDTPLTGPEISGALRMVLKRKKSLVCLNEDCGKVFRSSPGYLNHSKMCGVEVNSNHSISDQFETSDNERESENSEYESGVDYYNDIVENFELNESDNLDPLNQIDKKLESEESPVIRDIEMNSDYQSPEIDQSDQFMVNEDDLDNSDDVLVIPIEGDWSASCVVGDNFIFDEPQSFVVGAFSEITTTGVNLNSEAQISLANNAGEDMVGELSNCVTSLKILSAKTLAKNKISESKNIIDIGSKSAVEDIDNIIILPTDSSITLPVTNKNDDYFYGEEIEQSSNVIKDLTPKESQSPIKTNLLQSLLANEEKPIETNGVKNEKSLKINGEKNLELLNIGDKNLPSLKSNLVKDSKSVENIGDVSQPLESIGGFLQPQESIGGFLQPQESIGGVSQPQESIGGVSQPQESIGGVSQPQESIGGVSQPQESIGGVSQPQESIGGVSQPQESIGGVSQPLESIGGVSQPQESIGNVSQPLERIEDVSQPVEPAGDKDSKPSQPLKINANEVSQPLKDSQQMEIVDDEDLKPLQPLQTNVDVVSQVLKTTVDKYSQPLKTTGSKDLRPMTTSLNKDSQPMVTIGNDSQPMETFINDSQPMETTGDKDSQPMETTGDKDSQPMETTGDKDSQPMETTGDKDSQPMETTGDKDSQPMERTGDKDSHLLKTTVYEEGSQSLGTNENKDSQSFDTNEDIEVSQLMETYEGLCSEEANIYSEDLELSPMAPKSDEIQIVDLSDDDRDNSTSRKVNEKESLLKIPISYRTVPKLNLDLNIDESSNDEDLPQEKLDSENIKETKKGPTRKRTKISERNVTNKKESVAKKELKVATKMTRSKSNFALAKLKKTIASNASKPTRKTVDFKAKLTSKRMTSTMVKKQSKIINTLPELKVNKVTRASTSMQNVIKKSISNKSGKSVSNSAFKNRPNTRDSESRRGKMRKEKIISKVNPSKSKQSLIAMRMLNLKSHKDANGKYHSIKTKSASNAKKSKPVSLVKGEGKKLLASTKKSPVKKVSETSKKATKQELKNKPIFLTRSATKLDPNFKLMKELPKSIRSNTKLVSTTKSDDKVRKVSTKSKTVKASERKLTYLKRTKAMAVLKKAKSNTVIATSFRSRSKTSSSNANSSKIKTTRNMGSLRDTEPNSASRLAIENRKKKSIGQSTTSLKSDRFSVGKSKTKEDVKKRASVASKLTDTSTYLQDIQTSIRSVRKSTQLSTKCSVIDANQRELQKSNRSPSTPSPIKITSSTSKLTPEPSEKSLKNEDATKRRRSRRMSLDQVRVKTLRDTAERKRLGRITASSADVLASNMEKIDESKQAKSNRATLKKVAPASKPKLKAAASTTKSVKKTSRNSTKLSTFSKTSVANSSGSFTIRKTSRVRKLKVFFDDLMSIQDLERRESTNSIENEPSTSHSLTESQPDSSPIKTSPKPYPSQRFKMNKRRVIKRPVVPKRNFGRVIKAKAKLQAVKSSKKKIGRALKHQYNKSSAKARRASEEDNATEIIANARLNLATVLNKEVKQTKQRMKNKGIYFQPTSTKRVPKVRMTKLNLSEMIMKGFRNQKTKNESERDKNKSVRRSRSDSKSAKSNENDEVKENPEIIDISDDRIPQPIAKLTSAVRENNLNSRQSESVSSPEKDDETYNNEEDVVIKEVEMPVCDETKRSDAIRSPMDVAVCTPESISSPIIEAEVSSNEVPLVKAIKEKIDSILNNPKENEVYIESVIIRKPLSINTECFTSGIHPKSSLQSKSNSPQIISISPQSISSSPKPISPPKSRRSKSISPQSVSPSDLISVCSSKINAKIKTRDMVITRIMHAQLSPVGSGGIISSSQLRNLQPPVPLRSVSSLPSPTLKTNQESSSDNKSSPQNTDNPIACKPVVIKTLPNIIHPSRDSPEALLAMMQLKSMSLKSPKKDGLQKSPDMNDNLPTTSSKASEPHVFENIEVKSVDREIIDTVKRKVEENRSFLIKKRRVSRTCNDRKIKMVECQVCQEEIMEPKFNAHYQKHVKESKRKAMANSDTEDGNGDESQNGVPKLKKRTTRRAALMANSRLEEFVKAERIDEDGKEILSDSDHDRVEEAQQSESEVGKLDPKDKDYTVEEEETEKSDYSVDASADERPQIPVIRPQEWYRKKLEKDWPEKYRKPVEKTIDIQQKQKWRAKLQQNKYINCQNEGCSKRLLSISACIKHQKFCGDDASYICLLCPTERPFKNISVRKFYYHIMKHKTTTSGDAPAKPIGYKKYFTLSSNITRNYKDGKKNLQVNPKLTKYAFNFCENHHLAENFSGFRPLRSDWMLVKNPDDYLPKERESLNFKVRRLNDDTSSSWSKLKLFEVFESKSEPVEHITFNAGGPVWASAWCPTPLTEAASKETEQYAAVSISLDSDNSHIMTDITKSKGLIEIWNFGNLNQKILQSTPRLVLAIGHSYGEIRDMKWCPSGCWDHPIETFTTPEVLPRLGLLALACGDGCVRVLSIPHPELLDRSLSKSSQNTSKIYVTNPVFLMNPPESGLVSTSQKTCVTSIAFEKTDGHGKLAAGYGNGLVSLWDLRSNSPLIVACRRRPAGKGVAPLPQTLRPFHIFQAHSATVTSVTFSPVPNGRFLATCGYDRVSKIWDLDDTSVPTDSYRKFLGRDISWSCHWAGYFMAIDEGFTVQSVNTIFKECGYFDVGTVNISNHNSCIWKTSVSDWLNCEATCDVAGTVNMTVIPDLSQNILNLKPLKGQRWPIYTTQVCSLLEDATSSPTQSGTPKKGGKSKLGVKNDPSLFLYNTKEKITQNYGLVFIDAPLSSYNQLSSPEARSLTLLENIPHLYPGQFQIASVNNVSWNPNLGSHQWLLTAGQSGLVRLSCFSALKLPTINRLLAKVTKDNERT